MYSILVAPLKSSDIWVTKFNRLLEKQILKKYFRENNIEIKTYNSAKDLAESSIKDFGIKFSESMIRLSCKNNRLYKGYNLEYVS